MIQKTYHFYNLTELDEVIKEIHGDENYKLSKDLLIHLYNPRLDIDEELLVEKVKSAFPNACITGVSAAIIKTDNFDTSKFDIELSVTFFEKTTLIKYEFDLNEQTAFVSGRLMENIISNHENIKCLQIFYTSNSTSIGIFMREFKHHKIPIFGIKAGSDFIDNGVAKVYGDKLLKNGIQVVMFISEDLKLYMDNNLGWQPIGVEMAITKIGEDNCISEIDQKPAISIYSKYLNVKPNKYFLDNVCEFPLIIERNGFQIARVPSGYGKNGEILMDSDVYKGEHFRLAYTDKEKMISLTEQSSMDLARFKPESVFIFECGNRLLFLKEKYNLELEKYLTHFNQLSLVFGFAELFVTKKGMGGDLNSSLVVVGLSENTDAEDNIVDYRNNINSISNEASEEKMPYIERILTFFETTSKELDLLNKELGKVAYTDQLTKIYNRWELEKKIAEYLELSRNGKAYGMLFMDIDHFKSINDKYGHEMGDKVLRGVAGIVRDNLKEGHGFGRWGGEEFILLAPDLDENGLLKFAESIRESIEQAHFGKVNVTISIGATLARSDDDTSSFIRRADYAMYEAKETGRNKVVMY